MFTLSASSFPDRDAAVTAVTGPELLSTPASTPANTNVPSEPAPIPIPSQFMRQEGKNNYGGDADQHEGAFIDHHDQCQQAVHNQNERLFVDPHDQGSPAAQQGKAVPKVHEHSLNT
ncbi:hypothetical protein VE02_10231 [Pseudogymnoascus sp. 03VT05]|nr:hypothetical protein VE02_10231 [Pseudogymnoascus sp. 03VT05]